MARIRKSFGGGWIDSGPIIATSTLDEVPEKDWYNLMVQRVMFVKAKLPHDCRCLIQFVEDAERMYKPLGFKDADDFIARGLKLVPDEIRIAVDWLKINKPEEAVSLDRVLAERQIGIPDGKAGPGRGHKTADNVSRFKYGNSRAYTLARLDRDGHTELAAKVRSGELSANAAALQTGIRKRRRCPHCGGEL
jgi:hypothetical protein